MSRAVKFDQIRFNSCKLNRDCDITSRSPHLVDSDPAGMPFSKRHQSGVPLFEKQHAQHISKFALGAARSCLSSPLLGGVALARFGPSKTKDFRRIGRPAYVVDLITDQKHAAPLLFQTRKSHFRGWSMHHGWHEMSGGARVFSPFPPICISRFTQPSLFLPFPAQLLLFFQRFCSDCKPNHTVRCNLRSETRANEIVLRTAYSGSLMKKHPGNFASLDEHSPRA